jgi:hypothetical protein
LTKNSKVKEKIQGCVCRAYKSSDNEESNSKTSKVRNDIEDCASELVFARCPVAQDKKVSFDGIHDLIVDDIPVEIKTIHDKIMVRDNYSTMIRDVHDKVILNKRLIEWYLNPPRFYVIDELL